MTSFDETSLHGPSQDFVHAFMQGTESEKTISIRYATPERQRFPVIVDVPGLNAPSFENILNDWTHGDVFQVRMLAISHIQFSSLYQRSARFEREGMQFVPALYSLVDGNESYGWIARYTLEFIKAYLTPDRSARTFLLRSPSDNGVPARLMATSFRAAIQK